MFIVLPVSPPFSHDLFISAFYLPSTPPPFCRLSIISCQMQAAEISGHLNNSTSVTSRFHQSERNTLLDRILNSELIISRQTQVMSSSICVKIVRILESLSPTRTPSYYHVLSSSLSYIYSALPVFLSLRTSTILEPSYIIILF